MGGAYGIDEIEEESTEGLVGNLKEINCLEDLHIDGEDDNKMDLTRVEGAQTGFLTVTKRKRGNFLETQAKDLLASQERL